MSACASPGLAPRVAVVAGTRPELIKLSHICRLLGSRGYLVHSHQHYDADMSDVFLQQLGLPRPEVALEDVGGASRGQQFARIVDALTCALTPSTTAAVIVQGDTNTAAAAAQAAHFNHIPVLHVEAGLRSGDRAMPEEINRQLIGVVADHHCAPTHVAVANLRSEGVAAARITLTGNTVVEAALSALPPVPERLAALRTLGQRPDAYVLATIHRPENTDCPDRLAAILRRLADLPLPVLFPVHPRTRAAVDRHGLHAELDRLTVLGPCGYRQFLSYAAHARLIVSDSGGIQEEVTVLKRPLIVVRKSTERPEAIDAGFATLVSPGEQLSAAAERVLADADALRSLAALPSPYGDGTASQTIAHLALSVAATANADVPDPRPGGAGPHPSGLDLYPPRTPATAMSRDAAVRPEG